MLCQRTGIRAEAVSVRPDSQIPLFYLHIPLPADKMGALKTPDRFRINNDIRSPEVRVLSDELGNLGVMKIKDAVAKAQSLGMDLIEISPDAQPPVAKIADYGRFMFAQKKKQKEIKLRTRGTTQGEVKNVQIKVGTGENDILMKSKKAAEWLSEGSRVKIELYLKGRTKYMDRAFLTERLERILAVIPTEYKIVEEIKDGPKGLVVTIERAKK